MEYSIELGNKFNDLINSGYTLYHISKKYDITITQAKSILSKYKKESNTYNVDHIKVKYQINNEFFHCIKPKTILDLFCGRNRYWATNFGDKSLVISNDLLEDKFANPDPGYNIDANILMNNFIANNECFDLVDVDPYNSPAEFIDSAIKLAVKGLIITFGDLPNVKRFKKYDYFYKHYGITDSIENINIQSLAEYLVEKTNNRFEIFEAYSWKTCGRVYLKSIDI